MSVKDAYYAGIEEGYQSAVSYVRTDNSAVIERLERENKELRAALEHAGRGEPVAFAFESHLTGEMKDFSLTRHSVGMTPLYTQPPAPVVPEKREWNQATGRDGFKYTNGWNDCRETMLNATPKPSDSEANQ